MQSPLKIAYKGMDSSPSLTALIEDKAQHLEKSYDGLTHCQVTIDQPAKHRSSDRLFQVRIHLGLPGHEVNVDTAVKQDARYSDAAIAVRDAFANADRQLRDLRQRLRTQDSRRGEKASPLP